MLRTLGIKSRILVLAVPVAVVAVLAVVLGLATGAGATTAVLIGALGVVGVVATIVLGGIVAASITRPLDELGAAPTRSRTACRRSWTARRTAKTSRSRRSRWRTRTRSAG